MFLDLLIDVILLSILVSGSYLGYRRGFFAIAVKPVKTLLRYGASFAFCVPVGKSIIAPIISPLMRNKLHSLVVAPMTLALSTVFAFVLLLALSGVAISFAMGIINSCFSLGVIGKINSIVGMICAMIFSVLIAFAFIAFYDIAIESEMLSSQRLVTEFDGGIVYKLLKMINPFN